ncbi:sulfurtransferase [Mucilaginibacter sp. RS28]|uniref:Sulfurtransferase n=1 Tax=Mucilaginibacter straminoryzae TaxID=2932774 RepID=A0A9X2BAA7_9SPHI|nr:sulfurtransferase [Mucilaginibacter straminoryzae]MCJ8211634.1 sulfurtransferase [Mucilaginibacter straminoryzae]
MKPIITPEALATMDWKDLVIVDARSGPDAYQRYLHAHLQGAVFADLDNDLAAKPVDAAVGGRHPLPSPADFAKVLTRLGITPQSHVVIYDDKAGANPAARMWWMLKAIGHEQVQVLSGGLQAAMDQHLPVTSHLSAPVATAEYPVPAGFNGTADIEEVKAAVKDGNRKVIDVRESARYLGYTEPLDLIAGHIPGAVNMPYSNNMTPDNRYLGEDELKKNYQELLGNVAAEQVIVHCGSGVTACHTLLALEEAGLTGAKLYVGSWSEWSRRDLPIAKEEV